MTIPLNLENVVINEDGNVEIDLNVPYNSVIYLKRTTRSGSFYLHSLDLKICGYETLKANKDKMTYTYSEKSKSYDIFIENFPDIIKSSSLDCPITDLHVTLHDYG